MHARHRCKRIDIFAFHPNALCIVMANRVEEAVFAGKESWWHARVEDKCCESKKVCEGHCPSNNGKGIMRRRKVIIPSDETVVVNDGVRDAELDTHPTVPGICMRA